MKIGVVVVGYRCERLNEVLAPWVDLKHGLQDDLGGFISNKPENLDVQICWVSSVFKDSGYGEYDNEANANILRFYEQSGAIDKFIEIKDHQIKDFESRAIAWDYLKSTNPDIVIQLDGDEFWTYKEIQKALGFVKRNPYVSCFRVRFKNYLGPIEDKTYVTDFSPLRIINNKLNGGIKQWYHDNDAEMNDGSRTETLATLTIPSQICFPAHYSWTYGKDPTRIINKEKFQRKTLGVCSYKWNEKEAKLGFDMGYYMKLGVCPPEVFKDE